MTGDKVKAFPGNAERLLRKWLWDRELCFTGRGIVGIFSDSEYQLRNIKKDLYVSE